MNDTVEFIYHGDAEVDEKAKLVKTSQERQGYPVYRGEENFLFVGPRGSWILAPSCDNDKDIVLKHPKRNPTPNLPPRTGWMCQKDGNWIEEESIEAIVKLKVCYLVSSDGIPSGAEADKYNSKLGAYESTGHTIDSFPVFQKDKQYLFVNPSSGFWTIGDNPFGDIGYFRHPSRATVTPPVTGWQFRREDSSVWQENAAITVNYKDTSASSKPKDLPHLPHCIINLEHHTKAKINAVAISEDNRLVYTAGALVNKTYNQFVFIWDVTKAPTASNRHSRGYSNPSHKINLAGKRDSQGDRVSCMELQGNRLVVGGSFFSTRPIQVIDLGGTYPTFTSQIGSFSKKSCFGLALSPDGKMCYNTYEPGYGHKEIDMWDIQNEMRVGQLEGHTGDIIGIRVSGDGKFLWSSGSDDGVVRVWDLRTNKQLKEYKMEAEFVLGLACSPVDDSAVATYSESEVCFLYSGREGVEKYEVGAYGGIKFANSGKWFLMSMKSQQGFSTPSSSSNSCDKLFTLEQEDSDSFMGTTFEISKDDKNIVTAANISSYNDGQIVEVYQVNY